MLNLIAQLDFGRVTRPPGVAAYGAGGIADFISNLVKILIVGASIYATFNLVLAGYSFLSAGDDPKKIQAAWAKIWQTLIGLAVAASAIVLAAIFGQLLFGEADALLKVRVFGPNL